MRTLTWVTPRWPLPANDGARQATTQLLSQLSKKNVPIRLCAIVQEGEQINLAAANNELGVKEVVLLKRKKMTPMRRLIDLLTHPLIPLTVAPFATNEIARKMSDIIKSDPDTIVVYDGLHAAGWTLNRNATQKPATHVYRAHNVERDLWIRGAQHKVNPIFRAFLLLQGKLIGEFEKSIVATSAVVFPVSREDQTIFEALAPGLKIQTLPIGMRAPEHSGAEITQRRLLFVGRLDWAPNKDGLKWFLDHVWVRARELTPDLELTIVGSGNGSWLEPYKTLSGVKILGRVDSLDPHYSSCMATVVPVFYGSGTRVKAIESSLYKKACISTALGVEGIGLDEKSDFYRAETSEDWIKTLTKLDASEALAKGESAFGLVKRDFDPEKIADQFIKTVNQAGGL